MTASRSWFTLAGISLVLIFLPSLVWERQQAASPPGPYILTDLGTFGGPSAQAQEINDAGQVAGSAASTTSGGCPFIWQNGVMTDLGTWAGIRDRDQRRSPGRRQRQLLDGLPLGQRHDHEPWRPGPRIDYCE